MSKQSVAAVVVIGSFIVGAMTQVVVHLLDVATAKQCINHDWPAKADQIHKDWCIGNGYKI